MDKPINVLLYEDNKAYKDSFKLLAQKKRIIIDAVDNVDELIELLQENPRKHKFIVLDARAYLHEGETSGMEKEANLHKIFREVDRVGREQNRYIPRCINTGFAEVKLLYAEVLDCLIFDKGNEDALFEHILDTYNKSDSAKLRKDHPEIFEFADQHFDEVNLEILSNLLIRNSFESKGIAERVDNLTRLRRLNEHAMDILRKQVLRVSLDQITGNSGRRTIDTIEYARKAAGVVIPQNIVNSVYNIYQTCSNYGSHTPEVASSLSDYPTHFAIRGMTNSFFETVTWLQKQL